MTTTWARLVLYLLTMLGSKDTAQDAAQEAFVRLWEHREEWEEGSALGLLFRMGRNVALDYQRRAQVRRRWARDHTHQMPPQPFMPDEELEATEFQAQFAGAMETLPARRREVFELVRLHGLTHQEVADVMGISVQTVANQMALAHGDLRRLLADFLQDPGCERELGRSESKTDG
jgi:RNA polymerase sigma-70 factor (ECF subfamily)